MAFDCTAISQLGEALDEQRAKCEEVMERWIEISVKAGEVAAAAEAVGGVCLSLPAGADAFCLVHAGAARAAAQAAAEYAEDKAVQAAEGAMEAEAAKSEIDALTGHCESLEDWQEDAYQNLLGEAYRIAGQGVQAECGEETADLTDAEEELGEALALAEADAPDFG
jgi:hypothetical protein